MTKINISYLDVNFPKFSYTLEELVDNIFKNKLDEEARNFSKSKMGIERVYKAYDLNKIKQIDHISMKNKAEFYEFIYFIIFSDVAAVAILSGEDTTDKPLAQIDTETIFSLKDISKEAYTKASVSLMPDEDHRIKFHMNLNPKRLEETVVNLSYENYSCLQKKFPKDVENVKFWGLHTAGLRFVDHVREKCGIEIEKAKLNYDVMRETGNTGAISSLQLINESIKRKILTKNEVGGMLDFGWEGADAFLYTVK